MMKTNAWVSKCIQDHFTAICKSILSYLFFIFVTFEAFEMYLYPEKWLIAETNPVCMYKTLGCVLLNFGVLSGDGQNTDPSPLTTSMDNPNGLP